MASYAAMQPPAISALEGKKEAAKPADSLRLRPSNPDDEGSFFNRYNALSTIGVFRIRTQEELAELFASSWILEADATPVGSASLLDRGEWTEIAALAVDVPGKGFGQRMLQKILERTRGQFVYALSQSPAALDMFSNAGFESLGPLSKLQSTVIGDHFPDQLKKYDTSRRDPIFMLKHEATEK